MIPAQRTGDRDRIVITDPGHPHAGRDVTIVQPCGPTGFLIRIDGLDIAQAAPQYVRGDQIQEATP